MSVVGLDTRPGVIGILTFPQSVSIAEPEILKLCSFKVQSSISYNNNWAVRHMYENVTTKLIILWLIHALRKQMKI